MKPDIDGAMMSRRVLLGVACLLAYGPAGRRPDTKVGTFPDSLLSEAKAKGWTVISMKGDWKRIFVFE